MRESVQYQRISPHPDPWKPTQFAGVGAGYGASNRTWATRFRAFVVNSDRHATDDEATHHGDRPPVRTARNAVSSGMPNHTNMIHTCTHFSPG
jgi:hypothetical protein